MIKKEMLKLSSKERDIIFLWRYLNYPEQMTIKEISDKTEHNIVEIDLAIKKFNHNCKIKLEAYCLEKEFKKDLVYAIESFFVDKRNACNQPEK